MNESEVPISGAGLQDQRVVRVGDTVRRPAGPWTLSVHHLLRYLREHDFGLAPEPLGIDHAGRDVLSYVEGREQGWPFIPEIVSTSGAGRLGRLAARLRTALAAYPCPPGAQWQFARGTPGPGQAMQHGDLGPWNLLWDADGAVTAVLDWDFAQPGDPWFDTGHLAWFALPLMDDDRARSRGFPRPPDRPGRLAAFASGTGLREEEVLGLALQAQAEYERRVIARGSSAGSPWEAYFELGLHQAAAADRLWTAAHFGSARPG
jgi:hypothetical protein